MKICNFLTKLFPKKSNITTLNFVNALCNLVATEQDVDFGNGNLVAELCNFLGVQETSRNVKTFKKLWSKKSTRQIFKAKIERRQHEVSVVADRTVISFIDYTKIESLMENSKVHDVSN